ncbi:uncharacterized protein LOC131661147 [Vicia villosa]|uniref:uncharacterized protein LOC131661147 n=1 Tax=Vicia villosa TaxID=3911 RepID=UPI00273C8606|nr:uncharacterized protein LOC131661147 [Vicia villosa]
MNHLLRKNLLFFTSSRPSSQSRTLLVRFHLCEFSSSHTPYSHWKRHDEESRNVRVSVWWDFENCNVPAGVNVSKVAPAITDAVRANGIKGPVHITAFGDVYQISRPNQEALAFTGIHLNHIPNGGKNSADRSLLVDLMYWVSQNPPPAHLFLISGDRDFAGMLHRLRMNNYNILLASPGKAPDVLRSAATIMWQWPSLLKGEDLTGKHFNHPPDGQFGSWYGNSKVPLENPFSATEQSTSSQNVHVTEINEPSSDLKVGGEVPKSVIRKIKNILSLHPKGISISELRAELTKRDVSLGKGIFGYKRLSRFLSSIPHVQLRHFRDGNYCVYLIPSAYHEPSESSTALSTVSAVKNEEMSCTTTPKLHSEDKDINRDLHETLSVSSSDERIFEDDSKSFQSTPLQGIPIEEDVSRKSYGYATTPMLHSEDKDMDRDTHRTPSVSSVHERIIEDGLKSLHSTPSQGKPIEDVSQKSSVGSEKVLDVSNAQLLENQLSSKDNDVYKTEIGSFKVRSIKFSDDEIVRSENVSPKVLEKYTTSGNSSMMENNDVVNCESGKSIAKNKHEDQPRKEVDGHSPYSSAVDDSLVDERPDVHPETYSKRSTFLSWIKSWWPFQKSNVKADAFTAYQNNVTSNFEDSKLSELDHTASNLETPKPLEPHQDVSHSGKPVLFSSDSFWNDLESFVFTPKGSLLISQSRSREVLAHKLQKYGPMVLKSSDENDIIQLVELLIAEKKWLEESPSHAFPFRVTQSVRKSTPMGLSNGTSGLRSLFLSKTSQSNSQKSFENEGEKHSHSTQQTGVSRPATETKYTEKSRDDILQDCQKLVTDVLREHPEGYNIGRFRKQFADKYGYQLDIKKLGYQKMAYLIQIMPGVKLESTYIYPSTPAVCASDSNTSILKTRATNASHERFNSYNELSDTAPKEYNTESPWEELGPVSLKSSSQNDLESNLTQNAIELNTPKYPDYEPIVSDEDLSESEGDNSFSTQSEEDQVKPKYDEQDSSFWQALDSWHSSKEEENNVKKSENIDVLGNSLLDILNSAPDTKQGIRDIVSNKEKQRPHKYSFVVDPASPDNDKFIGGILDGLKKEDEPKMHN